MPPFWRRTTRDPSVKSYSTSSVVSTKSGSVENSSDIGIEKQQGIQRRDWYSPGERYEPEDRNLRFGTHDFCYEFIEVLPTASSVIGVIGKKRNCGEWSGSDRANEHVEGPELKIWLEKVIEDEYHMQSTMILILLRSSYGATNMWKLSEISPRYAAPLDR
jgi:hypothetical protein